MAHDSPNLFDEQLAAAVGLIPGGAVLVPSVERLSQKVREETSRRRSVALRAAESLAGCSREELADLVSSDPRLVPLLVRVLFAAGMNGHDKTLSLLGASLGLAISERERIDEAELILDAIERLGELEVTLLEAVDEQRRNGKESFLVSDIVEVAAPIPERLARLALSGLLAKGLMEAVSGFGALVYEQTSLGTTLLEVLRAHRGAT